MTEPKVKWEKWNNPLGLPGEHKDDEDEFLDEQEYDNHREEYDDFNQETRYKVVRSQFVVPSPFGYIPVAHHNDVSKFFNFWVGHTNFPLKKKHKDILNAVEGVETLDFFSKYRIRIGVGKAFSDKEVRENVKAALIASLNISPEDKNGV